jgi:acyl-CoA-binding protein
MAASKPPQQQQQRSKADSIPFPDRFELAAKFIDQEYGDLETNTTLANDNKLILYALRKQAEVGPCTDPTPYFWNVTARYKHGAWQGLGNMIKPEAMVHYVRHVEKLNPKWIDSIEIPNQEKYFGTPESSAATAEQKQQQQQEEEKQTTAKLGENSIELSSSPKLVSNNSNTTTKSDNNTTNVPASVVVLEDDISQLTDAQVAALLTLGKSVSESTVRGLVSEVLRLRRALVLSSALPASTSSAYRNLVVSPARVEHRYYGSESNNNTTPKSADETSRTKSNNNNNNSGGWFSWFGGGGSNNDEDQSNQTL